MKYFWIFVVLPLQIFAQTTAKPSFIRGKIVSADEAIPFAHIAIAPFNVMISNAEGYFSGEIPAGTYSVEVTAVGYLPHKQTIIIKAGESHQILIALTENNTQLQEVVVTGTMTPHFIKDSPVKVEVITSRFIQANPGNNVLETFQNVNGIQEQLNCGVCGTSEIRINGLEGPYTLFLIDGMPIMSALSSVYGLYGIPQSLIDRIEIIKGPSSTLYGSEAVGGVINIITKNPDKLPLLSVSNFYTSHKEYNADIAFSPELGTKLQTTFSGNYYRNKYAFDANEDNFTDIPLSERISIFNKWQLKRNRDRRADLAWRYYYEDRFGGEMQWNKSFRGSDSIYGESIFTSRIEVIGAYALPIAKENIRIDYSYNNHAQNSVYGDVFYKARQSVAFANFIYDKPIKNHHLLSGLTLRYDTYEDNAQANTTQNNFIPGVFAQDTWDLPQRTTLLAGLRVDYQQTHGIIVSPRLNVKYDVAANTIARINLGTGFRRVNLFTEDHAALTGSRTVEIAENLLPERSYNINLNVNHNYSGRETTGAIDLDVFYTYFTNRILPDYDTDINKIIYQNLKDYSISRGFAVSLQHNFGFPLTLNAGVTVQDVFLIEKDDTGKKMKKAQIFSPAFSGTLTLNYSLKRLKTEISFTGNLLGPKPLPAIDDHAAGSSMSKWYTIQNVQVRKRLLHGIEIFGGVKNIWNWTQNQPLVNPETPFDESFDTSYVWGPLQPRRFFLGVKKEIAR